MHRRRPPQPSATAPTPLRRGHLHRRQHIRNTSIRHVRPQAVLVRPQPRRPRLHPDPGCVPHSSRSSRRSPDRPDRSAEHRCRGHRTGCLELLRPRQPPAVDRHRRVRRPGPASDRRRHLVTPRPRHVPTRPSDTGESHPSTRRPSLARPLMTNPDTTIAASLRTALAGRKAIVICGRTDDAHAWQRLLATAAPAGSLVIALDEAARIRNAATVTGATAQLAWQHNALAGLDGTGWLAEQTDAFDPRREAVLILPDPLDPPAAGTRPRLGQRPAIGRLLEDKTV